MARINKSALTKIEIVSEVTKQFLEKGYSNTTVSAIAKALEMSQGNLTFYYPTKEHLLAELVDILCDYQWHRMEEEANEGISSILALCLEFVSMVSACEDDEKIKDFFLSSYSSPMCLEIIRKNDAERAKEIFREYRPDWTDEQFAEAEILVSGIEYATIITTANPVSLETRITGALDNILGIYGVPEDVRKVKLQKVFTKDCRSLGKQVLTEFKKYVAKSNDRALRKLLRSNQNVHI